MAASIIVKVFKHCRFLLGNLSNFIQRLNAGC